MLATRLPGLLPPMTEAAALWNRQPCLNQHLALVKIWELDLPKEVIIGCILRGESGMVPRGDTRLLAGDILVLISTLKKIKYQQ